jgi:CheY-like chemotaxis protein
VTDSGPGIPEEKQALIFDSFTQLDSSSTRRHEGTGLGLAICKRLVHAMGGTIAVQSRPGEGSRFTFTARCDLAAPGQAPRVSGAPAGTPDTPPRPLRILLAEDAEDNRDVISWYLAGLPYAVEVAENGLVAFEKATSGCYDVVLMDVHMPVLDGHEATRRIRQWERQHGLAAVPIIALTAYALKQAELEALAAGCTCHLAKPLRRQRLLDALASVTAQPAAAGGDAAEIDLDRQALVPGYLRHRRADLEALQEALGRGDYATIATLGHRMMGSGLAYGFSPISEIGCALEAAARAGQTALVERCRDSLARYLGGLDATGGPA